MTLATSTGGWKRRPGPKSRGPYTDKRRAFTARITESTRKRLEGAAAAADRSIAQEAEYRLNKSFEHEDAVEEIHRSFGGKDAFDFCRMLGTAAANVSRESNRPWTDDPETLFEVTGGWEVVIEIQLRRLFRRDMTPEEFAAMTPEKFQELKARLKEKGRAITEAAVSSLLRQRQENQSGE